ncbi:MAG: hypothetical protein LBG52_05795 [Candidatus Peribacteria bacterium]|jgi:uncharacterized protein YaiI (UPF0178 family)|nr:hypothetical protein [Candidatus Peribacteria bacterium]
MQAYEEETGEKLEGRAIVQFSKDTGEVSVHSLDNYEEDREAFHSALKLLKRKKFLDKAYKS